MQKTLVVMAAGIGSRFGKGIKQLEPVGPTGELIIDYSIHDALEAGFGNVVFIIRKDIERDFRAIIGDRIEKICPVSYAFQEKNDLPEGFCCPPDRVKPWGTGQAVLVCEKLLKSPFLVINADDYYGKESFRLASQFLSTVKNEETHYFMPGFVLKNTLSDNGAVTRGVCRVDEQGHLVEVNETKNIVKTATGAAVKTEEGLVPMDVEVPVSMNMWALTPAFLKDLKEGFTAFLKAVPQGNITAEYLLPRVIDALLKAGKATVSVEKTADRWFGVTYLADKESVQHSILELHEAGVYTTPLFAK